jgi:glycine/D-amino acid oxidase-like deaminating enzyme
MKEVDYIIVGCGLAGIAFCEQLEANKRSYVVYDDQSQQSSIVAAGLYNPVILKRFTEVWKAKEQLSLAMPFYEGLEKKLLVKLDYKIPVYRRFASVEEQNEWFTASDKPTLSDYLSIQLIKNDNPFLRAPQGFGEVLLTGRIDTSALISSYKIILKENDRYINESFDYDKLNIQHNLVSYKNIATKTIVFAEGFGMLNNPYFKELPLNVAKGEIVTIKAPKLKIEYALKSSIFVVPLGNDLYSVGATYNWEDKTNAITQGAKDELIAKLRDLITCDFEVVNQVAGIRPTVKDRRPLVGTHPIYNNLAILNGLGTRGVMLAPYVAKALFNHLEKGISLENDININRFEKL